MSRALSFNLRNRTVNNIKKYLSAALLLFAAIIWGFAFSAQKSSAEVPPFAMGAVRSLFASLFLFLLIPALDKLGIVGEKTAAGKHKLSFTKYELIGGSLCGVIFVVASALQQAGIAGGTDAGKASFITALYVLLVPVVGIFLKRKSPINVWISVFIAVVGFYFLCIDSSFNVLFSDLLVLLSALVFAFHILSIDRFSPKSNGVKMSFIQFSVSAVLNTVFALVFESGIPFSLIWENILPLMYLGIASSGIAYTLQIIGQRKTPPAVASMILSLESVFGVIGAAIFLKEKLLPREYIGCAIVALAVMLAEIDFDALKSRLKRLKNKEK